MDYGLWQDYGRNNCHCLLLLILYLCFFFVLTAFILRVTKIFRQIDRPRTQGRIEFSLRKEESKLKVNAEEYIVCML